MQQLHQVLGCGLAVLVQLLQPGERPTVALGVAPRTGAGPTSALSCAHACVCALGPQRPECEASPAVALEGTGSAEWNCTKCGKKSADFMISKHTDSWISRKTNSQRSERRGLNASIVHWRGPEQTAARAGAWARGRKHWTKGFPLLITQSIMRSSVADQMSLKILNLSFC